MFKFHGLLFFLFEEVGDDYLVDYFEQKLRLTDIEVWQVRVDQQRYVLILLDENRPATLTVFDIPGLIYEEDDRRANVVTATYYSKHMINEEHRVKLAEFAGMVTDHLALAHCEVIIKLVQEDHKEALEQIMNDSRVGRCIKLGKRRLYEWLLNQS